MIVADTAMVNVTVNQNPTINIIESDFSVCATSTSILSVEISPPSITGTYIWSHDPSLGYATLSAYRLNRLQHSLCFLFQTTIALVILIL